LSLPATRQCLHEFCNQLRVPGAGEIGGTEAPQILLDHRFKSLRLPTLLRAYGKLARQAAAEGLRHVQFLARLIELEMIDRMILKAFSSSVAATPP
jgi:hypothetical protein